MYNIVCLAESNQDEALEKTKKIIGKFAQIKEENEVGEMPLAYEIDDNAQGFYVWIDFKLKNKEDGLKKIKEKMDDSNLLRYLISQKPEEALTAKKEEEAKKRQRKKKKTVEKGKVKKESKKETKKEEEGEKKEESKEKETKKEKKKKKTVEKSEEERMEDLDKKLEDIL